jgi:oligoribonuclease NrnB/cAMP/cGMP phosphodiesterase (DHH superfamily)
VNKYDKVFVVDVSFGDRTSLLFDEWKDKGIDVTWIDHHKTAIDAMKDYNIKGKRRIGTAACELTWEYLFDDIETPNVVKLLSAYDVWDHNRFEWSDVLSFQYGMRGYCGLDVDMAAKVMDGDHDFIYDMIRNGEAILEYIVEKNRGEMNMFSFEADVFGYKAICMNTTEFNSATFEAKYNPKKHDLMMPFCWNGRFFRCTFYTTKEELDVSALARKAYPGGGGHKAAAGFQLSAEDMMEFLKSRKML